MIGESAIDNIFDKLTVRLEMLILNPDRDSEAARHDQLILPFITEGLGWDHIDCIPQARLRIPSGLDKSHIFRAATPKTRKPDILISPQGENGSYLDGIAAIEEKAKQASLAGLEEHSLQLTEYQALCKCVWGVLTDGDKWIIKRSFETWFEFENLGELKRYYKDVYQVLGKSPVLQRMTKQGTPNLLLLCNSINPIAESRYETFISAENVLNDFDRPNSKQIDWPAVVRDLVQRYKPEDLLIIQEELVYRGELIKEISYFREWLIIDPYGCAKAHNIDWVEM